MHIMNMCGVPGVSVPAQLGDKPQCHGPSAPFGFHVSPLLRSGKLNRLGGAAPVLSIDFTDPPGPEGTAVPVV